MKIIIDMFLISINIYRVIDSIDVTAIFERSIFFDAILYNLLKEQKTEEGGDCLLKYLIEPLHSIVDIFEYQCFGHCFCKYIYIYIFI